jgi:glycosyltransferase involved in cell wall biosynthesis
MKYIHFITGLDKGGAEKNLVNFTKVFLERDHLVISLTKKSHYSIHFPPNVTVIHLDSSIFKSVSLFFQFGRYFNKDDQVLGWLYHGQLAALLFSCLTIRFNYSNMVRSSLYEFDKYPLIRKLVLRTIGISSYFVSCNYYNSFTSRDQHESIGFSNNSVIVPNIHLDESRIELVAPTDFYSWRTGFKHIFVFIGRDHHDKGIDIYLDLAQRFPICGFIVVSDLSCEETKRTIEQNENIYSLPFQKDVRSVFRFVNCLLLTSRTESLPNVVIDSVTNKTSVIAFDVGDVGRIISNGPFLVSDIGSLDTAVDNFIGLGPSEINAGLEKNLRKYAINFGNSHITKYFN